MRNQVLFVILLVSGAVIAQPPQNRNVTDAKGLRQGTWTVTYDNQFKLTGKPDSIAYYRIITYRNGKPVGKVKDYFISGKLQFEGVLLSDKPEDIFDGKATWYREDGSKEKDAVYTKGKISSEVYYNLDGSVIDKRWDQLNAEATKAYQAGNYAEARDYWVKALAQSEKEFSKTDDRYWESFNNVGTGYYAVGDFAKAKVYYEEFRALTETRFGKEHLNYAHALFNLAILGYSLGDYESSLKASEEALIIRGKILGKESLDYGLMLTMIGVTQFVMGDYEEAEARFIHAEEIYLKTVGKDHYYFIDNLNRLAQLELVTGNLAKAELMFVEAIALTEKLVGKDHPFYLTMTNNLASVYRDMGRFAQAEQIYEVNIVKIEKSVGKEHHEYATFANNLAVLYEETQNFDKAKVLYEDVVRIYGNIYGKEHLNYIQALSNLAVLYDEHDFSKSIPMHEEVLALSAKALGKDHGTYARYLGNLATAYSLSNRFEEATPMFTEAVAKWEVTFGKNQPHYSELLCNQALMLERKGDVSKSAEQFKKLTQVLIEQINSYFPGLSEKEKTSFYQERVRVYVETFNSFAMKAYKQLPEITANMYDNQLATKGLLFDASNKTRKRILTSSDEELKSLYHQWQTGRDNLAKAYRMSAEERTQAGIVLTKLEEDVNTIEKQLSLKSSVFAKANDRRVWSWKDVQKKLGKNEAAVEVLRFRQNDKDLKVMYAALVLTSSAKLPQLVMLESGEQLEGRYIKSYRNKILAQVVDETSYNQFWAPIAQAVKKQNKKVNRIYFSPDGVYHLINLNTLQNPSTKKFIADEVSIQLVTSTRQLLAGSDEPVSSGGAALIGFPDYAMDSVAVIPSEPVPASDSLDRSFFGGPIPVLPGTEKEVKAISALLKNSQIASELFLSRDATETKMKSFKDLRILHVATHGFFLKDVTVSHAGMSAKTFTENPMLRSGILLAGAQKSIDGYHDPNSDDGILTAFEAMSLDLDNTELVVLSACETGLGEVRNGEGVYGLQRAFQVAGARAVLMSLWKVDDAATQELMTAFYSAWLKSGDMQKAFGEAQKTIRVKYNHPYYWGAFALIGN